MGPTVTLRILSVQHDRHGLVEVERTVDAARELAATIADLPGVEGVVPLATCNRVEIIVDAPGMPMTALTGGAAQVMDLPPAWDTYAGDDAVRHLFRVASGLESMVVGEREIAGQVRRALGDAQDAGLASQTLTVCVEESLRASRRVARETALAGAGRSVVSVALDLVDVADWSTTRALLVGTGAFAGAAVAALRARGVQSIAAHSASGRADDFAASHGLLPASDLATALAEADVVVACRGAGHPVITAALLPGRPITILDLALQRDVAPGVADLPGVTVVDLASVQQSVSPTYAGDTRHAEEIIDEGISEANAKLQARILDPAVVSLRDTVLELVADEVNRLPQGRTLTHDDAAHALRRLATRLLHVPSIRARQAAASGRTQEYLTAMSELYGIGTPDAELDENRCPATGYAVADLESEPRKGLEAG